MRWAGYRPHYAQNEIYRNGYQQQNNDRVFKAVIRRSKTGRGKL
jgi:hypothetical protein